MLLAYVSTHYAEILLSARSQASRAAVVCRRSGRLVEIVADADRHVLLRFSDGDETRLAVSLDMTAALQELQAVGIATKPSKSLWPFGSIATPAGKFRSRCSCLPMTAVQTCNSGYNNSLYVEHAFKVDTISAFKSLGGEQKLELQPGFTRMMFTCALCVHILGSAAQQRCCVTYLA